MHIHEQIGVDGDCGMQGKETFADDEWCGMKYLHAFAAVGLETPHGNLCGVTAFEE